MKKRFQDIHRKLAAPRTELEMKNDHIVNWNRNDAWKKKGHLVYKLEESTKNILACRRAGCQLNKTGIEWPTEEKAATRGGI